MFLAWMFTRDGTVSFTFLGNVKVIYHNDLAINTWKIEPKLIVLTDQYGNRFREEDAILDASVALQVRNGLVSQIEIYF